MSAGVLPTRPKGDAFYDFCQGHTTFRVVAAQTGMSTRTLREVATERRPLSDSIARALAEYRGVSRVVPRVLRGEITLDELDRTLKLLRSPDGESYADLEFVRKLLHETCPNLGCHGKWRESFDHMKHVLDFHGWVIAKALRTGTGVLPDSRRMFLDVLYRITADGRMFMTIAQVNAELQTYYELWREAAQAWPLPKADALRADTAAAESLRLAGKIDQAHGVISQRGLDARVVGRPYPEVANYRWRSYLLILDGLLLRKGKVDRPELEAVVRNLRDVAEYPALKARHRVAAFEALIRDAVIRAVLHPGSTPASRKDEGAAFYRLMEEALRVQEKEGVYVYNTGVRQPRGAMFLALIDGSFDFTGHRDRLERFVAQYGTPRVLEELQTQMQQLGRPLPGPATGQQAQATG